MFTKVNKIKNFGVYKNFIWKQDQTCAFQRFNLIYGWNYSGKTTLSRIFRCIELQKLHNIESDAQFEFEDNESFTDNFISSNRHKVKVFNSDFIKENLKWDSDTDIINPIFVLGEESIELRKELMLKEAEIEREEKDLYELKESLKKSENKISNAITNKARETGTNLNIRPFDKRHFLPVVEAIKANYESSLLESVEFTHYQTKALQSEQKNNIDKFLNNVENIEQIYNDVNAILEREIISANRIEKLLNDVVLSSWIEKGILINSNKDTCQFCGGPITQGLIDDLKAHFCDDVEKIRIDIEAYIDKLKKAIFSLPTILNDYSFYKEYREEYIAVRLELDEKINLFNSDISSLMNDLEKKRASPFSVISPSSITCSIEDIEDKMASLQRVIIKNNNTTANFDKEKIAALEMLKRHHAAEFIMVEDYFNNLKIIDSFCSSISVKETLIEKCKQEINVLKSKLTESVKGASTVNGYLDKYFAKDDISIYVDEGNNYILKRAEKIAKHLSEGEKTAIAFSYFIASLEENGNEIKDTIVYIDDPVSSLDSNHLFNTYSFIKDKFYKLNLDQPNNKHVCLCKQLFISTHNFELFNLIKDWSDKMSKSTQFSMYLVERYNNESVIKTMPKMLTKHKSEYSFLFSLIYKFHKEPNFEFEHLYNLPNVIRRFLESFSAFKFLSTQNVDENLDIIIDEPILCEKVRKFVHYHSHSINTTRMILFSDLSESIAVVDIVLKAIEKIDSKHYNALCSAAIM